LRLAELNAVQCYNRHRRVRPVQRTISARAKEIPMAELTVYDAPGCPDCRRTKTFLGEYRVAYDWIDVDQQPEALERMMALQGAGGRSQPSSSTTAASWSSRPTRS